MKLNKNLKNILSLFSIEFIARLFAFIAVTYLARVLGTSGFGVINIGLAVLSYAMIIANGGLTLLGTKKIAAGSEDTGKLTGDIFLTRVLFSFILFAVSIVICYFFLTSDEVRNVTIAYLFFLFPSAVLLEWFFHGLQRMDVIAAGRVAGMFIYLVFLLILVENRDDTVFTGFAWVAGGIANSVFLIIVLYKQKFKIKFNLKSFKFFSLLKESFTLGLAVVIAQFVVQFPVIYLGIVASVSDSGIFSAAYKLIILLLVFDRVFSALFFPKIIQYYKANREGLNSVLNTVLKSVSFFAVSVGIIVAIAGDFIVTEIFGITFYESVLVFRILVANFILTLINSVFTYTAIALNKEKIYTLALIGGMIIFLISVFPLTELYGAAGSGLALVLFECGNLVVMYVKLRKEFRLKFSRSILFPVIAALIIIIPLVLVPGIPLYLRLASSLPGIVIIGMIAGISKKEFDFIKKVFI